MHPKNAFAKCLKNRSSLHPRNHCNWTLNSNVNQNPGNWTIGRKPSCLPFAAAILVAALGSTSRKFYTQLSWRWRNRFKGLLAIGSLAVNHLNSKHPCQGDGTIVAWRQLEASPTGQKNAWSKRRPERQCCSPASTFTQLLLKNVCFQPAWTLALAFLVQQVFFSS